MYVCKPYPDYDCLLEGADFHVAFLIDGIKGFGGPKERLANLISGLSIHVYVTVEMYS